MFRLESNHSVRVALHFDTCMRSYVRSFMKKRSNRILFPKERNLERLHAGEDSLGLLESFDLLIASCLADFKVLHHEVA
jgi:hypothetical protein